MDTKVVFTEHAPKPVGPYSQAVTAGGFVYCSGQIAIDPKTGHLIDGDIGEETARVMENLQAVLAAAGSSLDKVVKTTIYLWDMDDFDQVNGVYETFFPNVKPARVTIEIAGLPKGAGVEIDCIAVI